MYKKERNEYDYLIYTKFINCEYFLFLENEFIEELFIDDHSLKINHNDEFFSEKIKEVNNKNIIIGINIYNNYNQLLNGFSTDVIITSIYKNSISFFIKSKYNSTMINNKNDNRIIEYNNNKLIYLRDKKLKNLLNES